MPLIGEAKKVYQREYMRRRRSNEGKAVCEACGSRDYICAHHPDYNKPLEVIYVCSACHKKLHLCLAGKQRTTSNPYINPLDKIARKQPQLDADGNVICGE